MTLRPRAAILPTTTLRPHTHIYVFIHHSALGHILKHSVSGIPQALGSLPAKKGCACFSLILIDSGNHPQSA